MKKFAVICGGGAGLRMGAHLPKQFLPLNGHPVLWHTLTAFLAAFDDLQIILVLPAPYLETGKGVVATTAEPHRIQITAGGETRHQSVKNGLRLVEKEGIVFVHDAVRCLVTAACIHRCYEGALQNGNAVPAIAAVDSIRIEIDGANQTADRNSIRIVQTPQTFLTAALLAAFEQPYDPSFTDEATVIEKTGVAIHLVEGEATNIKITTHIDLLVAEKILEARKVQ
ncbi:MAG: 2-C-methyl-D-erythritol 4-phosphate cytidylyltransferase [Ferruginibacter sp.]